MNTAKNEAYFEGHPESEMRYSLSEWIVIQKGLVTAEAILRNYAIKNGWNFIDYLPKGWPAKRIIKSQFLRTTEIYFALNFNYFESQKISIVIQKSNYLKMGNIVIGVPKFLEVCELTLEDADNVESVSNALRLALSK